MGKKKLIYGIGIVDTNYRLIETIELPKINGKRQQKILWRCPYYVRWLFMLRRCYSENNLTANPTYLGCSVCTEWLTFSNFKSWMEQQDYEGKQLDKDLLIENNLIYVPDTCVFISSALNKFITTKHNYRGECPLGVTRQSDGNNFVATVSVNGNNVYLGSFRTMYEAHCAWRNEKMKLLNEYIKNEKDPDVVRGLNRVYEKLKIEKLNNQETKRL